MTVVGQKINVMYPVFIILLDFSVVIGSQLLDIQSHKSWGWPDWSWAWRVSESYMISSLLTPTPSHSDSPTSWICCRIKFAVNFIYMGSPTRVQYWNVNHSGSASCYGVNMVVLQTIHRRCKARQVLVCNQWAVVLLMI